MSEERGDILSTVCCISPLPLTAQPVSNATCYSHASTVPAGRPRNQVSISIGTRDFSTAPRQAFSPAKTLYTDNAGNSAGR